MTDLSKRGYTVKGNGWEEISPVTHQPWGARLCSVTTVDGSMLNFFELD